MSKIPLRHGPGRAIYHDNAERVIDQVVHIDLRRSGKGGKPHYPECARLNQEAVGNSVHKFPQSRVLCGTDFQHRYAC